MRRSEYSFAPVMGRSKLTHAIHPNALPMAALCGTPAHLVLYQSFFLVGQDGTDPLLPDNLCKKCKQIIIKEHHHEPNDTE